MSEQWSLIAGGLLIQVVSNTGLTVVEHTLNKSENATVLLFCQNSPKAFLFQFRFCKIKCLTCSYHLRCTRVSRK